MKDKVSTKALLYQKFRMTGDDPADVTCNYIPTPAPGADAKMVSCSVEELPEGDLYPCLVFSRRYLYDLFPISGKKDPGIEAIPLAHLARLRS